MSFGENVGYYRRQSNITQEELAEKLYVSRQTVSRWETDSTFPDVETLIKLCEIFGCNMDTLVRGDAQDGDSSSVNSGLSENNDKIGKMKEELKQKRFLSERIVGVVAATLTLISILVYGLCGFLGGIWHPTWLVFVGAITVIAITAVVADAVLGISDLQKKIRYEKRKTKKSLGE